MKKIILLCSLLTITNAMMADIEPSYWPNSYQAYNILYKKGDAASKNIRILLAEQGNMRQASKKNREQKKKSELILLETEDGKNYKRSESSFIDCIKNNGGVSDQESHPLSDAIRIGTKRTKTKDGMAWNQRELCFEDFVEIRDNCYVECKKLRQLQAKLLKKLQENTEYQNYLSAINEADYLIIKNNALRQAYAFALHRKHEFCSEKAAMLAGVSFLTLVPKVSVYNLRHSNDKAPILERVKKEVCEFIEKEIE